jgi:hypothetical protein
VRAGSVDTDWLEREWSPAHADELAGADAETAAIAAALLIDSGRGALSAVSQANDGEGSAWRLAARQAALR